MDTKFLADSAALQTQACVSDAQLRLECGNTYASNRVSLPQAYRSSQAMNQEKVESPSPST